jgi:hypothetical protein
MVKQVKGAEAMGKNPGTGVYPMWERLLMNKNINTLILTRENNRLLSYFPQENVKHLFFDVFLSLLADRPVLDVWDFDDFIHEIYGRYEEEQGLSLYELLVKEKGVACAEYIKRLI